MLASNTISMEFLLKLFPFWFDSHFSQCKQEKHMKNIFIKRKSWKTFNYSEENNFMNIYNKILFNVLYIRVFFNPSTFFHHTFSFLLILFIFFPFLRFFNFTTNWLYCYMLRLAIFKCDDNRKKLKKKI